MKSLRSKIGRKTVASGGSSVDARLLRLLENAAVAIEAIDASTCHLTAVPVGCEFNKPRTNVLIKRMQFTSGSNVFVDDDLIYLGDDPEIIRLLDGPAYRHWQKLRVPPVKGMSD